MRLPATIVRPAMAEMSGTQTSAALPAPSRYSRKMTMKPAAFGATDNHATNGVLAASYVSGTHIWNGTAAILKPTPASVSTRPSLTNTLPDVIALAIAPRLVVPVAPKRNEIPYSRIADDTEPTRKNFSAPSPAVSSFLRKPVRK